MRFLILNRNKSVVRTFLKSGSKKYGVEGYVHLDIIYR
jgi:hypothetical protein